MQTFPITFRSVGEPQPGAVFAAHFEHLWPAYRRWFLLEGDRARPSYVTGRRMLQTFMPELISVYDRLVELAGGGDLAARMLSLYRPPPYLAACSQGVWTRDTPLLVRNYDYAPSRFEGVFLSSRMLEHRVIGTSDCLWGLLDGMNDAGLAVSLTFGGRRVVGDGFGIPLVVRYLLETCTTTEECRAVLARLPYTLSHNLTIVDGAGELLTAYLSPDREPVFARFPAATNHQGLVEWPEQARATRTVEREWHIVKLLEDPDLSADGFSDAFLRQPLFSTAYANGFGTLYTVAFRPVEGRAWFRWPTFTWEQSFDAFVEGTHEELLAEGAIA